MMESLAMLPVTTPYNLLMKEASCCRSSSEYRPCTYTLRRLTGTGADKTHWQTSRTVPVESALSYHSLRLLQRREFHSATSLTSRSGYLLCRVPFFGRGECGRWSSRRSCRRNTPEKFASPHRGRRAVCNCQCV